MQNAKKCKNAICRVLECQPGDLLEYKYMEEEELEEVFKD